jgi:Yip1 domain
VIDLRGMIKVFFLIFEPRVAWEKIALARRNFSFVFCLYLLPLVLVTSAAEGWGLLHWGKWQPRFEKLRADFTLNDVLCFEAVQTILLLLMVLLGALILLKASQTFYNRSKFIEAFTVMTYGASPLFLTHLMDAGPNVNPWAAWTLGILLAVWILYQGVPLVMQPDPTNAFGLYLSAAIVLILTSGLVRLLTGLYLLGEMDFHHSWLTHKFPSLFQP